MYLNNFFYNYGILRMERDTKRVLIYYREEGFIIMSEKSNEINIDDKSRKSIVDKFTEWSLNWVPDSMVFVLALTFIVFILALIFTKHGPFQLLDDYAKGFWVLLTFAMQLSIMMITGFIVADSKFVKRGIIKLVDIPKGPKATMLLYCFCVGIISWLHWGIGLMFAVVMGREIGVRKRGIGIHYPLLAAAGYSMFLIMANGPSQSAPLVVATSGNFLEKIIPLIPLTQTALSPFLLTVVFFEFITIPILFILLLPKKEKAVELDDATYKEFSFVEPEETKVSIVRPAEKWERSRVFPTLLGIIILIWVARFIFNNGLVSVDLNVINFTFMGLGLILQGTPKNFTNAVKQGVMSTYGVIIQFPLYAGIFGIISYSGMSAVITDWFITFSSSHSYAAVVMIYTTIMDYLVPSGGSKFVIEAPYIIPAGLKLGIPAAHVVNAYSTGGQMANLIQPFWALPFLASLKLRFQDILPYTFIIFIYAMIVGVIAFLVVPF